MKIKLVLAVLMVLALATFARASTVIYNNGGPNGVNGNEMTQWIQTEEFTLTSAMTLTDIHFWDAEATGAYTGSITWWITGDIGGNPDFTNILATGNAAVTHTATGICLFFGCEYTNDWTVGPLALAAGTEYHLALHNGPVTTTTRNNFYWETTGNVDAQTGLECDLTNGACYNSWFNNGQEHAFYLTGGSVPEPGSLFLLGSGLLGVVGIMRRKLML